ncbi:hypothetical protein [Cellulosimicrobium sp. Marseille-Q8652]
MSVPETPPPASPYGAAPHPYDGGPAVPLVAPPHSAPRRSGLALVSFWAGVATVVVGAVYTLALPVVLRSMSFTSTSYVVLQAGHGILSVVLALVAVITGLVVLGRRAPGTGFAAAGTALGAAAILNVVLGLLQGVLIRSF